MKIKNILIINQPVGNRGDESAHRALMHALNDALPEVHFTILAFQYASDAIDALTVSNDKNTYVKFIFPHNLMADDVAQFLIKYGMTRVGTALHPVLRRLLPYYRSADAVICAPGGICMGGFQNWRHMYLLQVARNMKKPIIYYSRSIGPFPVTTRLNRRFKRLSVDMLKSFAFLSLRDSRSKQIAKELGVGYVSSIDTAFLAHPHPSIPQELQQAIKPRYVVFVPNQLKWHFAFRNLSGQAIDDFNKFVMNELRKIYPEHQIVMLPQLCSLGEEGDYKYFRSLQQQFGDSNVCVVPDTYSSDIQQTIISGADMVVGARYHSVVFSINNEVPFMALSYEHKIQGLLEDLSLAGHAVDITKSLTEVRRQFHQTLMECKDKRPNRQFASTMATDCFVKMLDCLNNI